MTIADNYQQLPDYVKEMLENANVFFTPNYEQYIRKIGQSMIYGYTDALVVPVIINKKAYIRYAVYASEYFSLKEEVSLDEKKVFLNELQIVLKKLYGVAWISTTASSFFDVYPTDSMRIPFGSHVIDLENGLDTLWNNVHSKHRNSVRRAEKAGVQVRFGGIELLDDYYMLDEDTWKRSGKSGYGKAFFTNILETLNGNAVIYMAYKDSVPQAGALYYWNEQMCYYMFGVSADRPETGATNFMHWEAIKQFKSIGVKKYSFVGCRIGEDESSKYHSIQRFKERFGGVLDQGYMFKTVLNPWRYKLFHWLYKIKNRIELTDAVDQEIAKWPELQQKA